jgi:NTE family protein
MARHLPDFLTRRGAAPARVERTAFVLSGGASKGALQVGMLRALLERRIRPDVVVGCSVGAMNGAAISADPSLAMVGRLQDEWLDLDDDEIFPSGLLPSSVHLARKGESLFPSAGLRAVVERVLPVRDFARLVVPFQCVATDIGSARAHWFRSGPLVDAVMASAAIPVVYPPVEIDGTHYCDGGVVDDVPMARAVELGATRLYVLQVGTFDRPREIPRRSMDMAWQAYWINRRNRFHRDLEALPSDIDVVVLPTGEAPSIRFNDLAHGAELMDIGYRAAADHLDRLAGRPVPARPMVGATPDEVVPDIEAEPPERRPAQLARAARQRLRGEGTGERRGLLLREPDRTPEPEPSPDSDLRADGAADTSGDGTGNGRVDGPQLADGDGGDSTAP